MSESFPEFKTGNVSIRNALNKLTEYARRHGINPGGRPGWNQTADGWMPPLFVNREGDEIGRWDIVKVPDSDPAEYKLFAPKVRSGNNDVVTGLTIENDEFSLVAGEWVVLEIDGATFGTDPKATVKSVVTWDGYPANHDLGPAPNYTWAKTTIPIWKIVEAEDKTDGMVKIAEGLWGEKYISGFARLEYELFTDVRTRVVPIILSGSK